MTGGESLLDLLAARSGIVCAVGAGGKKSLLRQLALAHPERVAITATAFTTHFQEHLGLAVAIEDEAALPAAIARLDPASSVAYACPSPPPGRRAGVSPATIERVHRAGGFAATYVKADGARMRLVKAPAEDEPVLPDLTGTVIPVVAARAIGEPLTERVAHRVERVALVAQLRAGDTIAPVHVARLLASPDGLLKGTGGCRVVPLINMVDDAEREAQARAAAEIARAMTHRFDRVVLARLRRAQDPVVTVVER